MEQAALRITPDTQKRRSFRIAVATPLLVSGVDALGRSFDERTSTSIVNCHGCRYSSLYYVAIDQRVTLEVLQPERGRTAPRVRGRVMWMQRPRLVREPFHYGVELEVSGNFWGIGLCPADWFSFPSSVEDRLQHETVEADPLEPSVPGRRS
jgi:hypothetical protein